MNKKYIYLVLLIAVATLALCAYSVPAAKPVQNDISNFYRLKVSCIYQDKPIAALIRISEVDLLGKEGKQVVERWSAGGQLAISLPKGRNYRVSAIEKNTPLVQAPTGKLNASQIITNLNSNTIITLELHENQ